MKAAAVHPKSKPFHLPPEHFKEIERRAHTYPLPPEGFDALLATDAQLDRYGLPPRPSRETDPHFFQFWTRLLSKPFKVIATEFVKRQNAGLPLAPVARVGGGGRRGSHLIENSRNWSGAFVIPERSEKFVYVTGTWKVPALGLPPVLPEEAAASDEYQSSAWIGIDGHQRYPMSSMPQIGTSQILDGGGTVTTYAWWQWWSLNDSYPPDNRNNPPVPIPGIPVSVHDEIIAGLTLRSADEVQFFIKNQSTGLFTTFLVVAPGAILPLGSTAEWIVERPTVIGDHRLYPLPNYGHVVFRDCFAQSAPSIGSPATTCRLDRARLIRMSESFPAPHRTSFVSLPRKLSRGSIRVSYCDASAPGSGGRLT